MTELHSPVPSTLEIDAVDQEGRGVGRVDGKVMFVEGAIVGERVAYRTFQAKSRHAFAAATHILRETVLRTQPLCRYYDRCGGCSMQHIDVRGQVAIKQRILEDNLRRLGGVVPEEILPPIHGPSWEYRHRARLSIRFVPRRDEVMVGFNAKHSHHVVDMHSCEILPNAVSVTIDPLRQLLGTFDSKAQIAQLELAVGESVTVFLLRNLKPLTPTEIAALEQFGRTHSVEFYLQPKGPSSIHPLVPTTRTLSYSLPEFGVSYEFAPIDFTQINYAINRVLVRRAVSLLEVVDGDRILDLFCGLGNFSLPLARRGAHVVGVEGSSAMVEKAHWNARMNSLSERTRFLCANLAEMTSDDWKQFEEVSKLLIDPPRQGASAVIESMPADQIERIVYVSCNPATLARDAGMLVREKGFRLKAVGAVNMFPHTSHVESIALFVR